MGFETSLKQDDYVFEFQNTYHRKALCDIAKGLNIHEFSVYHRFRTVSISGHPNVATTSLYELLQIVLKGIPLDENCFNEYGYRRADELDSIDLYMKNNFKGFEIEFSDSDTDLHISLAIDHNEITYSCYDVEEEYDDYDEYDDDEDY